MTKAEKLKVINESLILLQEVHNKLIRTDVIYDVVIKKKMMDIINSINEWKEWIETKLEIKAD
jgi:hypothetical protein